MELLEKLIFFDGKFLGIQWHVWKVVGWVGNITFFSRFMVQWYFTEKQRRVVIPVAFWWLSLLGSLVLFTYAAFYRKDSVFIFAYAFTWIPYIRNLVIHYRQQDEQLTCPECQKPSLPSANFCADCGVRLQTQSDAPSRMDDRS